MQFRALAPLLLAFSLHHALSADRVIVGWNPTPLRTDPAQGQQAVDFTADVIREAARRGRIELTWRETRDSAEVDKALDSGFIELAPAAIPTPERRARFYLTEPWWNEDLALIVRVDGPQTEEALAGKRIALKNGLLLEPARRAFPHSLLSSRSSPGISAVTALVCQGEADAALMTHRDADMMLGFLRPPQCADARLSTLDSITTLGLVVMSRREKAGVARRLRQRIAELTRDGTLARIAARHPGIPASSAAAMAERMREHGRQESLWIAVYALVAITLLSVLALWRVHVGATARRKVERTLSEREEVLRRSNEDLQAYAYTVSHDLQEPLRMVTAYVDLLVKKHSSSLDEEARSFLNVVRTGAMRMSTMLRDLLEYSRAAQDAMEPTAVDTQAAVANAIAALNHRISDTGANIDVGVLPSVRGWQDQLERVFQNLLENALKYSREGVTPRIGITAENTGEGWRFSVEDNGIGFDMAYAERIFRVFQRLHGRSEYSGNGIGLSITRRIIERHGGRIWVESSEPSRGTCFCFTLPVDGLDSKLYVPAAAKTHRAGSLSEA